jgi:hypothetical protein
MNNEDMDKYKEVSAWKDIIPKYRNEIIDALNPLMFELGLIGKHQSLFKTRNPYTDSNDMFFGFGRIDEKGIITFVCAAKSGAVGVSTVCYMSEDDFMKILHGEQLT